MDELADLVRRVLRTKRGKVAVAGAGVAIGAAVAWPSVRGLSETIWTKAEPYNRRVVLVLEPDTARLNEIENYLIGKGYGVVAVRDAHSRELLLPITSEDTARIALERITLVRAVIIGRAGIGGYAEFSVPSIKSFAGDRMRIIEDDGRSIKGLERRVRDAIRRQDEGAVKKLGEISSYVSERRPYGPAPPLIADATLDFFDTFGFATRSDSRHAFRDKVLAASKTGAPIDPKRQYRGHGLCMKVVEPQLEDAIDEDVWLFPNERVGRARFAEHYYNVKPRTADGSGRKNGRERPEARIGDVMKYWIGPAVNDVITIIKSDSSLTTAQRDAAAEAIMRAVINVAVAYNDMQRRHTPLNPETGRRELSREAIERITDEHTKYAMNGFGERVGLMAAAGFGEQAYWGIVHGLYGHSAMRRPEWWVRRTFDMNLGNFKLVGEGDEPISVETPSPEAIRRILFTDGRVISPEKLESMLGVYDQGYQPRHLANMFPSAGYSPVLASAHTGRMDTRCLTWLKYFLGMESDSIKNSQPGMPSKSLLPAGLIAQIISDESLTFKVNVFGGIATKLDRFWTYEFNAAKNTEAARLSGLLKDDNYEAEMQEHLSGMAAYDKNLAVMGLCGALSVERSHRMFPPELGDVWSHIYEDFRWAEKANPEVEASRFTDPFASMLARYAVLGHRRANLQNEIKEHLDTYALAQEIVVRFK